MLKYPALRSHADYNNRIKIYFRESRNEQSLYNVLGSKWKHNPRKKPHTHTILEKHIQEKETI